MKKAWCPEPTCQYKVYVTRVHLERDGTPICPRHREPMLSDWVPEVTELDDEIAAEIVAEERQQFGTPMRADTYVLLDKEQDGQTCAACGGLHYAGDLMISSQASKPGIGIVTGYFCARGVGRNVCTDPLDTSDREIPGGVLIGCRAQGLDGQADNAGADVRRQRAAWAAERRRLDVVTDISASADVPF